MALKKNDKKQDVSQGFLAQRRHIINESSNFSVQEAYKTLRTNLRFAANREGCKRFCVTSGLASEGKSITVLNLAISFAQAGSKVLLIDADMRRPNLACLLIENGAPGLSNVLAGLCEAAQAIRPEIRPNLDIIFSGEIPPNPSELLGGERMERLIAEMSQKYDYIFVDAPPVGIVSDACLVGNLVDGALFVVRQNYSNRDSVSSAINQLQIAGVKIIGFIFNGVAEETKGKPYYYDRSYQSKPGEVR